MSLFTKKHLLHVVEHGEHSPRSGLHNAGGGGGGSPRKDPTEADMLTMTIMVVIDRNPDRDLLFRWIAEESGRVDARGHLGEAPVYDEAFQHQERAIDWIERHPRFKRGLQWLNAEMKRRLAAERVCLNRREDG